MLLELRLRNLAVAEDVAFPLTAGLNVLTGSTGAGKSLAVEALHWLRGEKVDPQLLRHGAETASAEALFDLARAPRVREKLVELGFELSSDEVLRLRREFREGRSRAWVDSRLASAAVLRALTDELLELQSQHQQLSLLRAQGHAGYLDQTEECAPLRRDYLQALRAWRELQERVRAHRQRQQALREQRELLEYQQRELEEAGLQGDEMPGLRRDLARLEGGARLVENVQEALARLRDEDRGAIASLQSARGRMRDVPAEMEDLQEALETLEGAAALAEEAARDLEGFVLDTDIDPEDLDHKQARLAELEALTRKYGRTEAELVDLRDRLRQDLDDLGGEDDLPAALASERESVRDRLQGAATALHRQRKRQARRLQTEAPDLLEELGMEGAALRFDLLPDPDRGGDFQIEGRKVQLHREGPTRVRLQVRTNPGEDFGPVETTASGGELSRIALVLRSLSVSERRPTLLLLDEVDAGLGADLGPALARRLRALADGAQVLAITHLPAVAALADHHLVATKSTDGDRTNTDITPLDESGREQELLRMIGGPSERARALARELRRGRADRRAKGGRAS